MGDLFDNHYGTEAEQYSYFRVSRILITDERFKAVSTDAKLLYGLMLDRMGLSMKNGWLDEQNRVYIFFTLEDIMEQLNCQHGKAVKLLAELDKDKGIGLVCRVKQGQGRPTKIYVMNVFGSQSRPPENGSADFSKSACSYPEINNHNLSYIDPSIHPSARALDVIDVDEIRETVKENLDYDIMLQDPKADRGRMERWYRCCCFYILRMEMEGYYNAKAMMKIIEASTDTEELEVLYDEADEV